MSYYDVIRFQFATLPAEQKLKVLRAESLRWLSSVQGHGLLLQKKLIHAQHAEGSDELLRSADAIIHNVTLLSDLIDGLIIPQQREERGSAELRPYESLLAAVKDAAHHATLSLYDVIDDATKVFIHSMYPLVLLDEPRYHREVSFFLEDSRYVVELLAWTEDRSFRLISQMYPPSLMSVAALINQWIVEGWNIEAISMQDEDG
jgi:hypothetical protein